VSLLAKEKAGQLNSDVHTNTNRGYTCISSAKEVSLLNLYEYDFKGASIIADIFRDV
jgi:hypothetical protein